MIKTFGIFIALALAVMQFPGVSEEEQETKPPEVSVPQLEWDPGMTAKSILVYDVYSDKRMLEHETNRVLPIASLTKIMTAHLALKVLSADAIVPVYSEALATEGTIGDFEAGEHFLVKDLLRAMMMSSSNDAAMALAEAVGEKLGGSSFDGKILLFVDEMNREARALGMEHTMFKNPTGLDLYPGVTSNVSTADDLERLLDAAGETPFLWELSREETASIFSLEGGAHSLANINPFVSTVPHFIGGKTGSTDVAGESIIVLYEYPLGRRGALVLLGAQEGKRFSEAGFILKQITPLLP